MSQPTNTDDLQVDSSSIERYEAESNGIAIRSLDDIKRVSLIFVKSGMFKGDDRLDQETKMYQAGVKIIAGVEFGIQPFAAMRGINIIKGNAEMSANLMAAKVKKHPKYDYRVKKWDRDGCELTFYEIPYTGAPRKEWEELGPSTFDAEDARAAGLAGGDNWRKFARNMYFARAMSNGVRIHCPDVFYGAPVYTEGEISGKFDDESSASEPEHDQPAAQKKADPIEAEIVTDEAQASPEDDEPQTTDTEVSDPGASPAYGEYLTDAQRKKIQVLLKEYGANSREDRGEVMSNIIMREVTSTNQLTRKEANTVLDELSKEAK